MRRFKFTLEKLLEIRAYKEKQIENELSVVQRKKNSLLEKKQLLLDSDKEYRKKMRQEQKRKSFTVERFIQYQQFFKRIKLSVEEQNKLIKLLDEEIALINKKLIEARKERRVLERLKEKKFKKYLYELAKEEQNFFDEVGTNSFIKRKREDEAEIPRTTQVKEKIEIPIKYTEEIGALSPVEIFERIISKGELLSD